MKTEYGDNHMCMNLSSEGSQEEQVQSAAMDLGASSYNLEFSNSSVACFNYTALELTITDLRKNPYYVSVSTEKTPFSYFLLVYYRFYW